MIIPMLEAEQRTVAALRGGAGVVVPFPTPLPYGIAGTSVAAVNRAKHRPAEQPAGMIVRDFTDVAPFLAVRPDTVGLVTWLCVDQRLNVFVPLVDDAPAWLAQDRALTGGTVGLMGSWLPGLRGVLDTFGHLYVSSANLTSRPPAVTAEQADGMFGGELLVVDGDSARDPDRTHGSATIIRVTADGGLELARHGVNDADFAGDFVTELGRRYAGRAASGSDSMVS